MQGKKIKKSYKYTRRQFAILKKARKWWEKNNPRTPWEVALFYHFRHGRMIFTKKAFILTRSINLDWSEEMIRDLEKEAPANPEAHYLSLVVGDLSEANHLLEHCAYLPFIAYHRPSKHDGLVVRPVEILKKYFR